MPFHLHPASLPTRKQRWAARLLALLGWRVRFAPLPGPRGIVIVYPHTSNWDMPYGLISKWVMDVPFRWLVKASYFRGLTGMLVGPLFRYWGGIPVERGGKAGATEQLARHLHESEPFWLVIAPEGTRSYRSHWRSGFYHLALASRLPVGLAYIDYATREVGLTDYIELSGDSEADMVRIAALYAGRQGRRPEQAAPVALAPPGVPPVGRSA
jgi:1-acyl-sn-glycerol-3-phosphate acyltransferase